MDNSHQLLLDPHKFNTKCLAYLGFDIGLQIKKLWPEWRFVSFAKYIFVNV